MFFYYLFLIMYLQTGCFVSLPVTVASLCTEKVRDWVPPQLQELACAPGKWSFCNISSVGHVPQVRGCVSLILAGKFVGSFWFLGYCNTQGFVILVYM
jgi:hypothetical protein